MFIAAAGADFFRFPISTDAEDIMQPKNLGWKFAFVGLLVAMSLYSIWAKELRQGIDLKGGHILTFEIQTTRGQREQLKTQIQAIEKQLSATTQPAGAEELNKRLAELKAQLDQLGEGDEGNVVQRVIGRLKDRIDPNGLYSLEWRPVGKSRFEVRMPLGTEEALRAKQKYLQAVQEIQRDNIQRSELRRVMTLTGEARAKEVQRISRGDGEQAAALEKAAKTHDVMTAARTAWEKARQAAVISPEVVRKAEDAYLDARAERDSASRSSARSWSYTSPTEKRAPSPSPRPRSAARHSTSNWNRCGPATPPGPTRSTGWSRRTSTGRRSARVWTTRPISGGWSPGRGCWSSALDPPSRAARAGRS